MKLTDYIVCCAWHTPSKAIVKVRTGEIVSPEILKRIPDTPLKDHVIHSGGFCDPCARRFLEKERTPLAEGITSRTALL
ncbi:MAG: hypothetical protein PHF60_01620 [Candidatus ainarchaeum sp.]|nr:hypothetical protein [Candidatus ainarchaeum sp.]